jgi:hypothetical protein
MYPHHTTRRASGDRLRLWVAGVVTVAALPLLWSGQNDDDTAAPAQVAAIAPEGGLAPGGGLSTEESVPEVTAATPGYLGGPQGGPPPAQVDVAVGTALTSRSATGNASYHRWPPDTAVANPCATPAAPYLATVTVTNLDNGYSVECVNTSQKRFDDLIVILHTDLFLQLSDLPEAPIPVSISW